MIEEVILNKKQKQKLILAKFMDRIWNNGDFTDLATLISPHYSVAIDPHDPWSGQIIDHKTFKQRVLYSRNAFADLNFDVHEMIGEKDNIAIRWIMSGTHKGHLPQLPATGQTFAISGMTFYAFDDDKISGHQQCFDQLGFLQQIGAFGST